MGADKDGRVLLKRSEAAWLARVSTETVRRWITNDLTLPVVGEGRLSRVLWGDLCIRAAGAGDPPPAHWSWLNADLTQPPGDASTPARVAPDPGIPTDADMASLRTENVGLRLELEVAVADAENLDQAVMVYRDNWRRRTQPQSLRDLGGAPA